MSDPLPAPEPAAQQPGPPTELARTLSLFDVTMVGVGAMIGAGIFALTGIAAGVAGPALILAFALNGILTTCTAMVYAEVGSAIPGAGGGYLWTRFGLPGPSAFLAGWMDWLAHAVAGSLYAVVFGSYVVWGMQTIFGWGTAPTGAEPHDMGTLFGLDAVYFAKGLTLAVCLFFIWVNYRGAAETGKTGSRITVAKIIVLAIFVAFGIAAIVRGTGGDAGGAAVADKFTPFLPRGLHGVLVAMGLTFIAFEGYEIIVQAGEEVVDPRRNIPRAIFWSLAIVVPVYLLVAVVCLGALTVPAALAGPDGPFAASQTWAYLAALGETGVAEAANQFMPLRTGAILLVVGAALSTMSALNATTYSSTRVSFAMGRDRYLPAVMGAVSPRTRSPFVALLVSGGLITTVALLLDAERVAAATCVMFLLVFAAVNVAGIMIRRKYGDRLRYGYLTPFFPLVPVLGVVGQLAVAGFLLWHEPLSLYMTAGWLAVGLAIYYTYSRHQEHKLKATPVVFEQRPPAAEDRPHVLVPVAHPSHAGPLIDVAARLARANDAAVLILHVVTVPEQVPYYTAGPFVSQSRAVVEQALELAAATGVPAAGLVRVAHHPARSIMDTIIDHHCRTLVLGWSGPKRVRRAHGPGLGGQRRLLGTEIDRVLAGADADTVVVRGQTPPAPRSILVPVANPRQGRFAVAVAEAMAGDETRIDLVHVSPIRAEAEERGGDVMEGIFGTRDLHAVTPRRNLPAAMQVRVDRSAVRAIHEASAGADLLIVGAAAETWLTRRAFSRFHYDLARLYEGPLLLVKLRSGAARFATQRAVEFFTSKEPER